MHCDRTHCQPSLNAHECAEAAVSAAELHRHEPCREGVHDGAPVPAEPVAYQPELPQALRQMPRKLGALPVAAYDRYHLFVDEAPGPRQVVELLRGKLLAKEEVVSRERLAEVTERVPVLRRPHHHHLVCRYSRNL